MNYKLFVQLPEKSHIMYFQLWNFTLAQTTAYLYLTIFAISVFNIDMDEFKQIK